MSFPPPDASAINRRIGPKTNAASVAVIHTAIQRLPRPSCTGQSSEADRDMNKHGEQLTALVQNSGIMHRRRQGYLAACLVQKSGAVPKQRWVTRCALTHPPRATWALPVVGPMSQIQKSLFGSFSAEKELLALNQAFVQSRVLRRWAAPGDVGLHGVALQVRPGGGGGPEGGGAVQGLGEVAGGELQAGAGVGG